MKRARMAGEIGISRQKTTMVLTRNFSAPDVFENTGAADIYNSNDRIMTEPALSRINEPFEP